MRWLAYILWALSFVAGLAALLLETAFTPWAVAMIACTALVRIEALHAKMDKFVVIED